jgi:hypothetical protein
LPAYYLLLPGWWEFSSWSDILLTNIDPGKVWHHFLKPGVLFLF